jgi:hypothetical protein
LLQTGFIFDGEREIYIYSNISIVRWGSKMFYTKCLTVKALPAGFEKP